ncbi:MAG: TerB N-terminal domain-containing protein [Oscillospiraceae bacterium]|nr:TerB N-terminal domain-containing protein [Oscillospiraceae bacterium]
MGDMVKFDESGFAEIEYEFKPNADAQKIAPVNLPIVERALDPIREKFYAMRNLASGNPFARNDAALFYKQAKFMEDFSDDFDGHAAFSMYFPYYQHMGYDQLRTYFTWRTKIRSGEMLPASLSYAFLYIYELLSGIGVDNPEDGLDKLMAVWSACRESEPTLDDYIPRWLKDYHIYYNLPHSFTDFVSEYNLQSHYADLFLFDFDAENCLTRFNDISGYDVTKSKFYSDGNESLLRDCFYSVLLNIREFAASRNFQFEDLFIFRVWSGVHWHPFRRALFYPWLQQPDRRVEISATEIYYCNGNSWTADIPVHHSGRREFVGYLIKKTESCLRQAVKYKFNITASLSNENQAALKLKELGSTLTDFAQLIEQSVAQFHAEMTRTVVTVDHSNLARIREEALGTQDKLIVTEEDSATAAPPQNAMPLPSQSVEPDLLSDGWSSLKSALSATERNALAIILQGTDIKAFADENGVMLEVLADGINEKAVDCIGDNILDDSIIYDEYLEKVTEMVE